MRPTLTTEWTMRIILRRKAVPSSERTRLRPPLLAGLLLLTVGCSADRVPVPSVSPDDAAKQALAEYDTNHDGVIDAKELERCPALKSALKQMDKNGDGKLSAQEIADHIADYRASKVGMISAACEVAFEGKPLAGATVTFTPEKFLGPNVKTASGVTDATGFAKLQIAGEELSGVHCGFFRVEISKKDAGGKETLPARYNSQTVLGQEVSPATLARNPPLKFRLTR